MPLQPDAPHAIRHRRAHVRIGAFPVGIEVEAFSRMARRAVRSSFVTGVLASMSGRAMIIGVDRLDYSKGIELRMDAFERFLAGNPEWHGNVTYPADHAEEPLGDPRIRRHGAAGERQGRLDQRQLRRGVMDADPLHQPRA